MLFCDKIIGSKNHVENSVSFSLLKSQSVIWSLVRKLSGTEQFDQKSINLWLFRE